MSLSKVTMRERRVETASAWRTICIRASAFRRSSLLDREAGNRAACSLFFSLDIALAPWPGRYSAVCH